MRTEIPSVQRGVGQGAKEACCRNLGKGPQGPAKQLPKKKKKKKNRASFCCSPVTSHSESSAQRRHGRSGYSEAPFHYKIPGPWITLVFIFFIFIIFFNFLAFWLFLGPLPRHMEIPRLGGLIKAVATGLHQSHRNSGSELHLQPTPQLAAMPDP